MDDRCQFREILSDSQFGDYRRTVEAQLHRRHFSVVSSGSSSASVVAPSVAVSSVLVEPDDTQEWGREGDAVTSPTADLMS